jgi:hypothetical protein
MGRRWAQINADFYDTAETENPAFRKPLLETVNRFHRNPLRIISHLVGGSDPL